MDLLDKSEADLQRGAAYGARASAVIARHSLRVTARVGQRATQYSLTALLALLQNTKREVLMTARSRGRWCGSCAATG